MSHFDLQTLIDPASEQLSSPVSFQAPVAAVGHGLSLGRWAGISLASLLLQLTPVPSGDAAAEVEMAKVDSSEASSRVNVTTEKDQPWLSDEASVRLSETINAQGRTTPIPELRQGSDGYVYWWNHQHGALVIRGAVLSRLVGDGATLPDGRVVLGGELGPFAARLRFRSGDLVIAGESGNIVVQTVEVHAGIEDLFAIGTDDLQQEPPQVKVPLNSWVTAENTAAWVRDLLGEAEDNVPIEAAVRLGHLVRYWEPPQERSFAVVEQLLGGGRSVPQEALAWLRQLSPSVLEDAERQGVFMAEQLLEELEHSTTLVSLDGDGRQDGPTSSGLPALVEMHGDTPFKSILLERDDLESAARALKAVNRGDRLQDALERVDAATVSIVRLPEVRLEGTDAIRLSAALDDSHGWWRQA